MFEAIAAAFRNNDKAYIDNYKVSEYNKLIDTGDPNASVLESVGLGNDYRLSESGELDGYGKEDTSEELGWNRNIRSDEASAGVDKVGHLQQKASDTPNTKDVHRSRLSATVVTSSQVKNTVGISRRYFFISIMYLRSFVISLFWQYNNYHYNTRCLEFQF